MVCLVHVRPSICPTQSHSVVPRLQGGCVRDVQSARCLSLLSGLTVFLLCKSTKLRLLYPECICRQSQVTTLPTHSKPMSVPRESMPERQCKARFHVSTEYPSAIHVSPCVWSRESMLQQCPCVAWLSSDHFGFSKPARTSMEQRLETGKGKVPKRQSLNRLCRIRAESAPETSQKSVLPPPGLWPKFRRRLRRLAPLSLTVLQLLKGRFHGLSFGTTLCRRSTTLCQRSTTLCRR